MTASPHRAWLGVAPLALLLAMLLGMAAPGASAPERGIAAGHRAAALGARIARPGSASPGAMVAAAQAQAAATARPHGAPAALVARAGVLDGAWRALSPEPKRAAVAPPLRIHAYDPRGPPSTTA